MAIPHVAIYSRVSTNIQAEEGMSMDSQPIMVKKKLDEVFGKDRYTYVEFSDEGKSGGSGPKPWATERRTGDRKGLSAMLDGLRKGEFSHVAAFRLDRIYRDLLGHMGLYAEVMKPRGIEFILAADTFDTSSIGQFTQGILAGVAELQRHQICDNIKRNLDLKREQGFYLGTIPFGWRREALTEAAGRKANIVPIPSEQAVVIRIKEMYLSGSSEQAIAETLNLEKVPHKKSVGKWRANTVNLVLVNPTHAGLVRQPDGSLGKGLHILARFYDESVLSQIQGRLARNRKRLKGVACTQPFRLFSGIVYCGHCGGKLQGSFHTESPGYRCLGFGPSRNSSHVYISAKPLEELVVAELAHLAASPAFLNEIESQIESLIRGQDDQIRRRTVEIRTAKAEVEKQTDKIIDSIAGGVISQPQARKKMSELECSQTALEKELHELEKQLNLSHERADQIIAAKKSLSKFTKVWAYLSDSERREALHLAIERIDVFAGEEVKYLQVKFVWDDIPKRVDVLRGAERYRTGKVDGVASLTPRELATLKHTLDGANYVQIARYFETTLTNAHALLARATRKLKAGSVQEAARLAEPMIRRIESQLPLYGPAGRIMHSPKRLKVMEYQILGLAAEGVNKKEIALRTGLEEERVASLLDSALVKLQVKAAKTGMNKLEKDDSCLPVSMCNRRRIE